MYRRNRPEAKPPPGVTYQEFKQRDTGSRTIKNPSTGDKSMPAGPEEADEGLRTTYGFASTTYQDLRRKVQRFQEIQKQREQGEVHPQYEIGVVISDIMTRNKEEG